MIIRIISIIAEKYSYRKQFFTPEMVDDAGIESTGNSIFGEPGK